MKKRFIKTFLIVCLVFLASFGASCKKKCKEHDYVDGVCSKCEAVDPDYKPHVHEFVEGTCECGEVDPNYVSPLDQFKVAMAELETATSTINCDMVTTMSYESGSQSVTMTQKSQLYIESSSTETYTVTTLEDEKTYTYAVQEGEDVKSYYKKNAIWVLLEVIPADEYSGMEDFLDVEVIDAFTLKNDVWVGDVETLSNIFAKLIEDNFFNSNLDGMTLKKIAIKKYNITVTDGKISLVDIEIFMRVKYSGMTIEYTIEMPMLISKIGETKVTVPVFIHIE